MMGVEIPTPRVQNITQTISLNTSSEFLHSRFFPYDKRIARSILMDKHIMFIGDSLTRALYKDMIVLITDGRLNTPAELRMTNESSCHGDKQIDILRLEANRVFRQAREFQTNQHLIQFFFTSRAMRNDLEKTLLLIESSDEKPDFVVMNSAIWDVSRYHEKRETSGDLDLYDEIETIDEYLQRIAMVCRRMRTILPPTSMFIFVLMPVTSKSLKTRGFLHYNHFKFQEIRMRMMEANMRAAAVVRAAGFDVLDLSYHFRNSSYDAFRVHDGVHWNQYATRFMNQLLLGHIASVKAIEVAVLKKWKNRMRENVFNQEKRHPFLASALNFLNDLNQDKHRNEKEEQKLRSNAVVVQRVFPVCSTMGSLRAILMCIKISETMKFDLEKISKSFSNNDAIKEMFGFSQEQLFYVEDQLNTIRNGWHKINRAVTMHRLKKRLKRRIEEKEEDRIPDRIQSPVPRYTPNPSPSQIPLPPPLLSPKRIIAVPIRRKAILPNPPGVPRMTNYRPYP